MKIKKYLWNIYTRQIILALFILLVLVLVVLAWLNHYTRHGEQVAVPNVYGLQVEQAIPLFRNNALQYEVIDSIYAKNQTPGIILKTVPPIATNVKKGRKVYLTLNAFTAQLLTVPAVADISQQTAVAMLQSLGFEHITTRAVPGSYRDLTVGLETATGRRLEAGDRIAANTPLVLLINSGQEATTFFEEGAAVTESESDESWY
ncbi:MAG: PASTA domain-containing protein [Candidatus Symbiothrix sp.]|jgi:beta-lactam-binding protein with PASTA domain|nr:PASTA domain-containing protein [Candidatus Symbiothrix sp.]